MKIAICGCGWSGNLLANTLSKDHEVTVYEKSPTLRAVCAWGIPTDLFREIAENYRLNADDYILWQSKELIIDAGKKQRHIPMKDLCTFNKLSFMTDISSHSKARFFFNETLQKQNYKDYDLIVDATGSRFVLGRLPTDKYFLTYQVKAQFDSLPYPVFYMRFPTGEEASRTKYLWMFPLSDRTAHVGCGSINGKDAYDRVQQFIQENNAKTLYEQAKLLRINPPQESLPFYRSEIYSNKAVDIVGVGNNVGAITSFGEGNQLSAQTVKLLSQNLTNPKEYQKQVIKTLGWLKYDYNLYDALIQDKIFSVAINMIKIQIKYRKVLRVKFNTQLIKNIL